MTLAAGDDVTVAIRWADPWGASANNYDLALYSGSTEVASSTDIQAGAGDPFEFVEFTAPAAGRYDIKIRRVSGAPTSRMQLMVGTDVDVKLSVQVADGTLPTPADSANPGMLAVGAVNVDQPGQIEAYSSRGPTLDGRVKPDLVAADCAPTTIEDPFCGTSESAPFVTGAAAQVLQVHPGLTPAQLAAWLRSRALPLGSPIPNSTFGAGRLDLGALPFGSAANLAYAWPPTGAVAGVPLSGQPVVKVVDATGLVIAAGPGSASDIACLAGDECCGRHAFVFRRPGRRRRRGRGVVHRVHDRPARNRLRDPCGGARAPAAPVAAVRRPRGGVGPPLTLAASPSTVTVGTATALTAHFAAAPATAERSLEIERSIDGTRLVVRLQRDDRRGRDAAGRRRNRRRPAGTASASPAASTCPRPPATRCGSSSGSRSSSLRRFARRGRSPAGRRSRSPPPSARPASGCRAPPSRTSSIGGSEPRGSSRGASR